MTSAPDPDAAALEVSLAQLARRYPDLSPDEQTVVGQLVGTWVKED
jgi:hypothetical protein